MSVNGLGDLYRSYASINRNLAIRTEIDALSEEAATGRKADLAEALRADFVPLAGIERDLTARAAYALAAVEASDFAAAAQNALERIDGLVTDVGPGLLSAASLDPIGITGAQGAEAEAAFETAIEALNGRFVGRALFAGTDTTGTALASAADILAALQTAIAADTTAADVETTVETWFAPGGGFDTLGYTGSADPLAPMRIGEGASVTLGITAEDAALREVLTGLALGALVRTAPAASDPDERADLARRAGERVLSSQSGLAALRAELGVAQRQIEEASVRTASETSTLDIARNLLLAADPFETAARLSNVQAQLEAFYAVTARTSRLSLTEYLR